MGYADLDALSTPAAMTQPPQEYAGQNVPAQHYYPHLSVLPTSTQNAGFVDGQGPYHMVPYPPRIQTQQHVYQEIAPVPGAIPNRNYEQQQQPVYYASTHPQPIPNGTPTSPDGDKLAAEGLSDALGELKIDDVGIGTIVTFRHSTSD